MKKTLQIASLLLAFLACAAFAFGQTTTTSTTLSSAITSTYGKTIVVASATGFTTGASTPSVVFIDSELMDVQAVNSTTITVVRGYGGTRASTHASGALVWVGPPNYFQAYSITGSCTATNLVNLPWIDTNAGRIYTCDASGRWAVSRAVFVPAAACGASTTGTAGTGNNTVVLDGSVSALKVASTNAGTSHNIFTCNVNVDSRLATIGRGARLTDITFVYSQQGTATGLTMIAPVLASFTAPAAGTSETASSATLVTAGGTLTVTPVIASANLTAISAGQYYTSKIALASPIDMATDLKSYVLAVEFDQANSTATLITTPGFWLHYSEYPVN
jgi:hypothetical protein